MPTQHAWLIEELQTMAQFIAHRLQGRDDEASRLACGQALSLVDQLATIGEEVGKARLQPLAGRRFLIDARLERRLAMGAKPIAGGWRNAGSSRAVKPRRLRGLDGRPRG